MGVWTCGRVGVYIRHAGTDNAKQSGLLVQESTSLVHRFA